MIYPQTNQIETSITYTQKDHILDNKEKNIILQGWRAFGRFLSLKYETTTQKI